MKRLGHILILLLIVQNAAAQGVKRSEVVQTVADVLFESASADVRKRNKQFEDALGIKLNYRVETESLDKIGGLSEHLFKLFQSIASPINTNVRTITGEFSALDHEVLTNILSYKSYVTRDLRTCVLPLKDTDRQDSIYNNSFRLGVMSAGDYSTAPQELNDFFSQTAWDYENILAKNSSCPPVLGMNPNTYLQHVQNTRAARAAGWLNAVGTLTSQLNLSYSSLTSPTAAEPLVYNSNADRVNVKVKIDAPTGRQFINLNNSVDKCTADDIEARARLLYAKTNTRFFFITQTVDFYIPLDSAAVFRDQVTNKLLENNADKNFIVAIWLRMEDPLAPESGGILLVHQNGTWLTTADIDFAQYNNGGNYRAGTLFKFNALYRNIPKPLMICYQVAKVNGLLTTCYLSRGQQVKGNEQVYYHAFRIDKSLREIHELDERIKYLSADATKDGHFYSEHYFELQNAKKARIAAALLNPEFTESDVHFKEVYLQRQQVAEAAAMKYLKETYGGIFSSPAVSDVIERAGVPDDVVTGTCHDNDESDVIGDILNVSSLLLAPAGLDFIPDALSVFYYASTDQTSNFCLASASMMVPGSLSGIRKAMNSSADIINAAHQGAKLVAEGSQVIAQQTEHALLAGLYGVSPARLEGELVSKANANPGTTRSLLTTELSNSNIYEYVNDLPEEKRVEFLTKCYDDATFRNKCLSDPGEVLRWGKVIDMIRGVSKDDFVKSVAEFSVNTQLADRAWNLFKNEQWGELEDLVKANNINGGWPPNSGFVEVENVELDVNFIFDRYGSKKTGNSIDDKGRFVADAGTDFTKRALPSKDINKDLVRYKVLKKFTVKKGRAIPWFNQEGFGVQYQLPETINDLIEKGYIMLL